MNMYKEQRTHTNYIDFPHQKKKKRNLIPSLPTFLDEKGPKINIHFSQWSMIGSKLLWRHRRASRHQNIPKCCHNRISSFYLLTAKLYKSPVLFNLSYLPSYSKPFPRTPFHHQCQLATTQPQGVFFLRTLMKGWL